MIAIFVFFIRNPAPQNPIAAMALIVDAKDQTAKSFYQHFDFIPLQNKPLRLFLPMTAIKKLFGH